MYKSEMYSIINAVLSVFVFLTATTSGNPLSRMIRSSAASGQHDGPFSTCSNSSSLSNPQLYYPTTNIVPVHAFDANLLAPGDYDTESSIPEKECPYNKAPTVHSLSESGLCPYDFYEDYQVDRIPAKILKARCRPSCNTCIDPFDNTQTSALACKLVVHPIRVMRRVACEGSVFKYEQYDEHIPVACMCQRTVRQPTIPDPVDLPPM